MHQSHKDWKATKIEQIAPGMERKLGHFYGPLARPDTGMHWIEPDLLADRLLGSLALVFPISASLDVFSSSSNLQYE